MRKIIFTLIVLSVCNAHSAALFGRPNKVIDGSSSGGNTTTSSGVTAYSAAPSYSVSGGSCGSVPGHVKSAFSEAKSFTNSCSVAKLATGKYIAVNDYSGDGKPTMYIFDQTGGCVKSVPISWGMGSDKSRRLEACSTDNSHKTPPGFHITARHNGARYNDSNSLGLAGLSGQDSLGARGVVIHGKRPAGAANTWGCTGVPFEDLMQIKRLLGVGSLVYNYFGDTQSRNCSDSSGTSPTCKPEAAAVAAASEARGERITYSAPSGGGYSSPKAKKRGSAK
ncbi:hypothetical protein [Bdellovibrio sp. HCB-162]|uniref:hypothetical protein n=1 Tax=Bdellovibrio sp. HCB-162 TaxID=3394234 RepID=UPI0039BD03C2